jgi:excisionase family DNA binding protein
MTPRGDPLNHNMKGAHMAPKRSLLTMTEVCDWLGVSGQTIRRAMAAGLNSRLLGSRRRFLAEDIEAWFKIGSATAPAPVNSFTAVRWTEDASELPASMTRAPSRRAEAP